MKEGFFKVAKSFMLYRQAHTEDRETLAKLQFLSDYMESANAATSSKFDANANVEHKNIATLIGELPKSNFIRLNRRLLTERIKKMYDKELADQYIDLLTHHFIYKNDETGDGAEFLGLVERYVAVFIDMDVLTDHVVHHALYLTELFVGDFLEV